MTCCFGTLPAQTQESQTFWFPTKHRLQKATGTDSGAELTHQLLEETPTHGQWKWEMERATRAVQNYSLFLKEGQGRTLVEYWRDTGEEMEFIRKSSTGTVESWFPPSYDKVGDTVWDDIKAYENRKDYATQKHEELLDRVVGWLSRPGDLPGDRDYGLFAQSRTH